MDLHNRLAGKRIQAVMTNGHVLMLVMEDGAELQVAWLDGDGKPIKGKPAIVKQGLRLVAAGMQDLIKGQA